MNHAAGCHVRRVITVLHLNGNMNTELIAFFIFEAIGNIYKSRPPTWINLSSAVLDDAGDDEQQQEQTDDAHEYYEPSGRRSTFGKHLCNKSTGDRVNYMYTA
jgi:hypothetical protein